MAAIQHSRRHLRSSLRSDHRRQLRGHQLGARTPLQTQCWTGYSMHISRIMPMIKALLVRSIHTAAIAPVWYRCEHRWFAAACKHLCACSCSSLCSRMPWQTECSCIDPLVARLFCMPAKCLVHEIDSAYCRLAAFDCHRGLPAADGCFARHVRLGWEV